MSIESLMTSIRWYLRFRKGQLGGGGPGICMYMFFSSLHFCMCQLFVVPRLLILCMSVFVNSWHFYMFWLFVCLQLLIIFCCLYSLYFCFCLCSYEFIYVYICIYMYIYIYSYVQPSCSRLHMIVERILRYPPYIPIFEFYLLHDLCE